jgi:FkbM family methyltransferase
VENPRMKLKEVFYMLGLKPKPRSYPSDIVDLDLPGEGRVQYAVWQHPRSRHGRIDQGMIDELRKYLSPGDTAIDIGAQVGDTTVPMAFAVGKEGVVFGLEPNDYTYAVLAENARLNRDRTNIVPLNFAATPEDGKYVFEYSDAAFCNGGQHENISKWRHGHAFRLTVEGKNLTVFLKREYPQAVKKLRFLKVDAEGADGSILASLSELIAETRPFIRTEVFKHLNDEQRDQQFDALARHNYTIHRFNDLYEYRGQVMARRDMRADDTFDLFATPN